MATKYWVLSRALYVVRILDLQDVPIAKRPAALALAQTAWTPFADTAHYVIPQQDGALICAWNRAAVLDAQAQADVDIDAVLVLPETALRLASIVSPMPMVASSQVVTTIDAIDGVIATVSLPNRITAEQWWPDQPNDTVWANFQRGIGIATDARTTRMPTPSRCEWRRAPIGFAGGAKRSTTSMGELWTIAAIGWFLAAPTIWYANEWRQLNTLKNEANTRLVATERELDATLGARGQALSGLDRANRLAALFGQPDNLTLFTLVANVLSQVAPADTLQLTEWDLRGQQLKFVLSSASGGAPSATTLVKAFEKATTLRDVEVNVDGARIAVSARVNSPISSSEFPSAGSNRPKPVASPLTKNPK